MKKYIGLELLFIIISIIITLSLFKMRSWYNLGDKITRIVAVRLTVVIVALVCLFNFAYVLFTKFKK